MCFRIETRRRGAPRTERGAFPTCVDDECVRVELKMEKKCVFQSDQQHAPPVEGPHEAVDSATGDGPQSKSP